MPISINPIFPVIAAQSAAPEVVLQPGTVIDALVLKILTNDLVRIAIANLSIEVLSEIPLQVGQTLQLAVSQTPNGIKLAVVGQGAGPAPEQGLQGPATATTVENSVVPAAVTPAPDAAVSAAAIPPVYPASLKTPLTPLQALAVSAAAQTAATHQASLAPLFANLGAAAVSDALPAKLQQAVAQVLSLRPNLDENLTGDAVKVAFENSGLFLESSLASKTASPAPSALAGVPDLKAALIVLRQTLVSLGAAEPAPKDFAPTAAAQVKQANPAQAFPGIAAVDAAADPQAAPSPASAPSLVPEIDVEEVFLPQARLPVADDLPEANGHAFAAPPPDAGLRAAAVGASLNLLQEALQAIPQKAGDPARLVLDEEAPFDAMPSANGPQNARFTTPPPFRGALPSSQPIAPPSLAANAPLTTMTHRLLDDTDAAIARQTLLQVASLPDRTDIAGLRTDPAAPRWNFEIPFATPAGTAIAQFEISRDGSANAIDAAKRVWRARFSLDVEPAGPVHALISLSVGKTSVRMWAERPATATQLRAGATQLSRALSRAELQPGDIVIRQGAPAQSAPAPAGHFLDRAL